MRTIMKCPCEHKFCKSWFVFPEAAVQCVSFTERQAKVVKRALDALDRKIEREERIASLGADELRELYDVIEMYDGIEVPKDDWSLAEHLKALGLIALSEVHGPEKHFKRAEPVRLDAFDLEEGQ